MSVLIFTISEQKVEKKDDRKCQRARTQHRRPTNPHHKQNGRNSAVNGEKRSKRTQVVTNWPKNWQAQVSFEQSGEFTSKI